MDDKYTIDPEWMKRVKTVVDFNNGYDHHLIF